MGIFVTNILPQATFFLSQTSAYSGGFYSLGFSSQDLFLPYICVAKTIHPRNVQVHTWIIASLESSSAFTRIQYIFNLWTKPSPEQGTVTLAVFADGLKFVTQQDRAALENFQRTAIVKDLKPPPQCYASWLIQNTDMPGVTGDPAENQQFPFTELLLLMPPHF